MSTINERFRKIREELGQSQEDFAQKASRTRSEIKNIEYGKTTPKPEVIKAVCCAWGINEEWLVTGTEPKLQSLSRQEEITKFVTETMGDANKTDTQRILTALMDATPEEITAIANFARRIAAQYMGIKYETGRIQESSTLDHFQINTHEQSHQPRLLSSPRILPGADGPVEVGFLDPEKPNTP